MTTTAPTFSTRFRKHPKLGVLPIVILAAVGLMVGFTKPTLHTAQARVYVGDLAVKTDAVPGMVEATTNLAASYARVASTDSVVIPAAQALNISPSQVSDGLLTSQVVNSPEITIESSKPKAADAQRIANAVANSLHNYVANLISNDDKDVLGRYQQAIAAQNSAQLTLDAQNASMAQMSTSQKAAAAQTLANDQGALATATLQANALASQYNNGANAQSGATTVQIVQPAKLTTVSSKSKIELPFGIGLLAGIALGAALVYGADGLGRLRTGTRPTIKPSAQAA